MQCFFEQVIRPYILEKKYKNICEIGSEKGGNAEKLLLIDGLRLSIIDPCLDADLGAQFKGVERVKILKGLSLEILPKLSEKFDCILIDGDHNWYTVYNELKIIEEKDLIENRGTIFLHDVGWPYGRRDMYYLPESIPEEFRHPYLKRGIYKGQTELSESSVFNRDYNNAVYEGGPKNGVLTAAEDFLKEFGEKYLFFYYRKEFGLGFLIRKEDLKTKILTLKWFSLARYYEILADLTSWLKRLIRG